MLFRGITSYQNQRYTFLVLQQEQHCTLMCTIKRFHASLMKLTFTCEPIWHKFVARPTCTDKVAIGVGTEMCTPTDVCLTLVYIC